MRVSPLTETPDSSVLVAGSGAAEPQRSCGEFPVCQHLGVTSLGVNTRSHSKSLDQRCVADSVNTRTLSGGVSLQPPQPQDLAVVCFTSGTTGTSNYPWRGLVSGRVLVPTNNCC